MFHDLDITFSSRNLSGTEWILKEQLEDFLVEQIADLEYNNFVNAMDRLVNHSYSYRNKDFIEKFRKPLMDTSNTYNIPKPEYDESGRCYVTVYECLRKSARADVTIRSPGTGVISINGKDINYFVDTQPREQVSQVFRTFFFGKCKDEVPLPLNKP